MPKKMTTIMHFRENKILFIMDIASMTYEMILKKR